MNTAKLLIECLRTSVAGRTTEPSLFEGLSEADFKELFNQAKRHDVANAVGAAFGAIPMPEAYECVRGKFEKEQYIALFRCENIVYEIQRITEALSKVGIDHILLKGAIIRDLYPEPWMRNSCDIDVLVREEDIDGAITALTGDLGYSYDGNRNYHDVSLFSPSGVHLELHFSIKENIPRLDSVLTRVWEHSNHTENDFCHKMSREFFVYHILAHMAYHFVRGGCGIRPVLDLWLIKNKMDFDEAKLRELCYDAGIDEFYGSVSNLAEVWFSDKEHDWITEYMQEYILTGGVYGTKKSQIALKQKSRGGKSGYARSRIWMDYDHLRSRYPKLKNKAMVPFYQVRRWTEILFEGNLKKGMHELKMNRELDPDKVSAMTQMMSELGLEEYIK
jgi:hypothetical protein